jgi:translocation protein SEC72
MKRHLEAIGRYTMAASVAAQRYPWEANQFMREELSTILSNRSAAYFEAGDYIGAIADADTVIQLRRNWSKGHFRKAKGLLGLGKWEDAKDAVRLGLQFEPNNKVCSFTFAARVSNLSHIAGIE